MTISLISGRELLGEIKSGLAAYSLIDAREEMDYLKGHIPGAQHIAWEQWCGMPSGDYETALSEPGYWGLLDERIDFADRLSNLGLSNVCKTIVYADGLESWGREGRIAWMLLYLGTRDVLLLEDGWADWLAAGGPIEQDRCLPFTCSRFKTDLQHERRLRINEMALFHQRQGGAVIVDTRSQAEFEGKDGDFMPRAGHLPGSLLFPFNNLFNVNGSFITRDDYFRLAPAELFHAESVVAYCEVGVRAATFALRHETYTGRTVPVYDGSLMEWTCYKSLPIACLY